jgi:hypothetical protein
MENGEVYIMSKAGAGLRLKNNGKDRAAGGRGDRREINMNGNVNIGGSLKINGQDCRSLPVFPGGLAWN